MLHIQQGPTPHSAKIREPNVTVVIFFSKGHRGPCHGSLR